MASYSLKIVTPEKVFFDGQTQQIVVRTTEGDIGILSNHTNYVCNTVSGPLKIKDDDGDFREAAVSEGILKVIDNRVTMLVSTAEWADEIDVERAKAARERAQKILEKKESLNPDDFARAEVKLKRALTRISIGSKYLD